jgi:hypothetical protein
MTARTMTARMKTAREGAMTQDTQDTVDRGKRATAYLRSTMARDGAVIGVPPYELPDEPVLGDDFVTGARVLLEKERERLETTVRRLTADGDLQPRTIEGAEQRLTTMSSITDAELRGPADER